MTTMFIDSLRQRVKAMNTLWERAAQDMTLEQVNHHERPGVLPIAFSFNHFMRGQDQAISQHFLGETPIWARGNWAMRVGVSVDRYGKDESVAEMERLRFSNFEAWKEYQSELIAQTHRVLDRVTEDLLAEVVLPPFPAGDRAFCALVVGAGNPVRKLDVLECIVYQHGLRHMGEVEHGRALIGLPGGMTA